VNDDQADSPILANDLQAALHLLLASSANNRLVSINPRSGRVQWEFVADAPIRFSPTVREGVVYFGADDGYVRALDLSSGQAIWKVHLGPELKWIFGNGRLISPHPVRTSVICNGDLVFACAGLFPSQGVYAACLGARDGTLHWRRRLDKSPQGYMLQADDERLIIPEGRAAPFMLSMLDGQTLKALPSPGGSFCMLTPEAFFAGPGNSPRVESFPLERDYQPRKNEDEPVMLPLEGRATAAGHGLIWVATGKQLVCYNANRILNQAPEAILWTRDCTLKQTLIVSGDKDDLQLFVAEGPSVHVFAAKTGELLHTLSTPDASQQIVYLAVDGGNASQSESSATLVATARSGAVFCWQGDASNPEDAGFLASPSGASHRTPLLAVPSSPSQKVPDANQTKDTSTGEAGTANQSPEQNALLSAKGFLSQLPVTTGVVLVIGDREGLLSSAIVQHSRFYVVNVLDDWDVCRQLQRRWQEDRIYGHQATVRYLPKDQVLPLADDLINAVIEVEPSSRDAADLSRVLTPGTGRLFLHGEPPQTKQTVEQLGAWRHQYCNPSNHSATQDDRLATASTFRLQWFGGVGPQSMPDRHLRGQAPLAAGASLIMHGDGSLIGVDPANGFERWRIELPAGSMRYVMPYDAGYSCLTLDGTTLFTATSESIWSVDSRTGQRMQAIPVPSAAELESLLGLDTAVRYRWGYLAESAGWLFSSLMKTTAPRLAIENAAMAREKYSDQDYTSGRPLVCSRGLQCQTPSGNLLWHYRNGVIINSTISVEVDESHSMESDPSPSSLDGGRIVFVESRSHDCLSHDTDRISLETLMQEATLVCLDARTGHVLWQREVQWPGAVNILYTQIADHYISLVTSSSNLQTDNANYAVRVHQLDDGQLVWEHGYPHIKQGLYHGEQVHHPVILRQPNGRSLLVVEPYLYDLKTGNRHVPNGAPEDWSLQRPGHSCGSLSGCGYNLYFRANNPTVLNLQSGGGQFTALSPSRPGCWINIIPSAGRLLIPEASASCVCHYPLQTSMAFVPVYADDPTSANSLLEDVRPTTPP